MYHNASRIYSHFCFMNEWRVWNSFLPLPILFISVVLGFSWMNWKTVFQYSPTSLCSPPQWMAWFMPAIQWDNSFQQWGKVYWGYEYNVLATLHGVLRRATRWERRTRRKRGARRAGPTRREDPTIQWCHYWGWVELYWLEPFCRWPEIKINLNG